MPSPSLLLSIVLPVALQFTGTAPAVPAQVAGKAQAAPAAPPAPAPPFTALTVGGGPHAAMTQVAIEKNVGYFTGLLPKGVPHKILFADGRRATRSVQYLEGRRLRYRRPALPRIDGATTRKGFEGAWRAFVLPEAKREPSRPLFLYFTGHGTPSPRDLDENRFDYWGGGGLTPQALAEHVAELPEATPVVLVMAQCFSGAFGNLLFEGGAPDGEPVSRDLVGFFAATRERPASGCTPEINEESYQDFSSYFFAALSGRDRLGRGAPSADYDRDGSVGMDEAFAYVVLHQDSEDVPVATSDVFLRRFVGKPDKETMATPFRKILAWARPAERAALLGLSKELGLRGDARLARAYDAHFSPRHRVRRAFEDEKTYAKRLRFIRMAKSVVLASELASRGEPEVRARFARLREAERRNPLASPPRTLSKYSK